MTDEERREKFPVREGTILSPSNMHWARGYRPPKGWEDEPGIAQSKANYDALMIQREGRPLHIGRTIKVNRDFFREKQRGSKRT